MCLDECPPGGADPEVMRAAVRRTILWAERCRAAHRRTDQALFAIVQGGTDVGLRAECAEALVRLDFPGYALGGFSVGETADADAGGAGAVGRAAAGRQAALPDGRRPAGRPARRRRGRHRHVRLRAADAQRPQRQRVHRRRPAAAAQRQAPARFGAAGVRLSVLHVPAISAGRTCITCSWRTRCWGRRCCRCTTSRSTCG